MVSSLGICISVLIPSSQKDTSPIGLGAHPNYLTVIIASARTFFSNEVTFTGADG